MLDVMLLSLNRKDKDTTVNIPAARSRCWRDFRAPASWLPRKDGSGGFVSHRQRSSSYAEEGIEGTRRFDLLERTAGPPGPKRSWKSGESKVDQQRVGTTVSAIDDIRKANDASRKRNCYRFGFEAYLQSGNEESVNGNILDLARGALREKRAWLHAVGLHT